MNLTITILTNPAFLEFFLVSFIITILYLLWNYTYQTHCFRVKHGISLSASEGNTENSKNNNFQETRIKIRRTSLSQVLRVKNVNDNVRTTMIMKSFLKSFYSKNRKKDDDVVEDSHTHLTDYIASIITGVTSSDDVSVAELEKTLGGLKIPCIVEDSKRIIVAYKKKY